MGNKLKYALAAITVLTVLGVYAYYAKWPSDSSPEVENEDGVFRIGIMSSNRETDERWRFLAEMALAEINAYCDESGIDRSFEFVYSCADGQSPKAIDLTKEYHKGGVDLVLGYGWSSFICSGARNYADENGMVLLSPSATSPLFKLVDNVFRLCPQDGYQHNVITKTILSLEKTDIVVLMRSDAWARYIFEGFKPHYEQEGGRIHAAVEYLGERNGIDYTEHLERAASALKQIMDVNGSDSAAVLLLGFAEVGDLLVQADEVVPLTDVIWFGTDATAKSDYVTSNGTVASKVVLISPYVDVAETETYARMNEAWQAASHEPLDFYDANIYDGCWVLALSALEVDSDNGTLVREVIHDVACNFTGASGPCLLDEYGDRTAVDCALWGYFDVDGSCECLRCGIYRSEADAVEWDTTLVALGGG